MLESKIRESIQENFEFKSIQGKSCSSESVKSGKPSLRSKSASSHYIKSKRSDVSGTEGHKNESNRSSTVKRSKSCASSASGNIVVPKNLYTKSFHRSGSHKSSEQKKPTLSERLCSCCTSERERILQEEELNKMNSEEDKSQGEDPVILEEEVPVEQVQEFPEMVKRSVLMEYKPFEDDYIHKLKVKWLSPIDVTHTIDRDTESFNVEFEAINPDAEYNTRWPIYSTLVIANSNGGELEKCTSTIKEIRPGVKAKFLAKIKTPKIKKFEIYQFQIVDEFGRAFGEPKPVRIEISDENIIDLTEEFQEPIEVEPPVEPQHLADKLYPEEQKRISEMGVEINDAVKDKLLQVKGRLDLFFEEFQF